MRRKQQYLTITLIAAGLVYGGPKLYVHYKAKSAFEDLSGDLAAMGNLTYDRISSTLLTGRLTYHDVTLASYDGLEILTIDAVEFMTPGFSFLTAGITKMNQGQLPDKLDIEVRNAQLGLYNPLISQFDDMVQAVNAANSGQANLCGNIIAMGPTQYREMGYESLSSDFRIGYTLQREQTLLNAYVDASTQNMGAIHWEVSIEGVVSPSAEGFTRAGLPKLTRLEALYTDDSYIRRTNQLCADADNLSVEEYIDALVNQSDEHYTKTWGFTPGPGLKHAFAEFLSQPENVRFTITPTDTFSFENFALFEPQSLINLLQPTLEINGKNVEDLSIITPEQPVAVTIPFQPLFGGNQQSQDNATPDRDRRGPTFRYYPVSLDAIESYQGRNVRIMTVDDIQHNGVLTEVTGSSLVLQRDIYGGEFSMEIPKYKVAKAEAWLTVR